MKMMTWDRQKLMLTLAAVLAAAMMTPTQVSALDSDWNYTYSNPAYDGFGKPTSIEPVQVIETTETGNINRSKDSAFVPPLFGSYSADTKGTGELLTPNISGVPPMAIGTGAGAFMPSGTAAQMQGGSTAAGTGISDIPASVGAGGTAFPPSAGSNVSFSYSENKFTLPDGLYDADNSIGRLEIPSLELSVKVYETESLQSLAKGAGHFKSTSCWDGNVGICGHNRGVTNHFGKIHTLENGDTVKYTTKLGTRTYQVVSVTKIEETNFSSLERTSDNRITLITCVNNQPTKRWCVQAVEK